MKSDRNIRLHILKAFEANLLLTGCIIEVEVVNGDVKLTGSADKYCKKQIARKIAKEVDGVKHVFEQITIVIAQEHLLADAEIEKRITDKFIKNFGNAHTDIKTIVKDGYVWLEGRVKWKYQRELAEECIGCLDGIKMIDNNIHVPESAEAGIKEKDVFAAIYSDRSITSDIRIEIVGHRVILNGFVENVDQKNLVTRLVRNVAGVREIENFLLEERRSS
ncbi:MAG: hypothetical protein CFE23_02735 [Flavobacterium sp. BFFFF1]|uniref:BON domain-containing protein n=1 Tax=Flavobacterium sp. BFFFF1 TaxID=2015557 RepID=UPI000BD4A97F|nr:BON domain-containing protein [Flavobacterium sp. BFFFF1]OYU81813.1 MAG: hypothetical protein CFE23_02735 [Flavobacterium sp. BFFFF1]